MGITPEIAITDPYRFDFGKNWTEFSKDLTDACIAESERALRESLQGCSLEGRTFLDIGCGSGLSSLTARRLGAKVHAFDLDVSSVRCSISLRQRFRPDDVQWQVEQGSVLDERYLRQLGTFDIVYSWGVLHHTGRMWQALENAAMLVAPRGMLLIALYNDKGVTSQLWRVVKRIYNQLPPVLRSAVLVPSFLRIWGPTMLRDSLRGDALKTWRNHVNRRGMSAWHDLVDWVGGYPYEVAKPDVVIDFYRRRGFDFKRVSLDPGVGCNEFVFQKSARVSPAYGNPRGVSVRQDYEAPVA